MDDATFVVAVVWVIIHAAVVAFLFFMMYRCVTRELREMEERARQADQWRWERTEKITE